MQTQRFAPRLIQVLAFRKRGGAVAACAFVLFSLMCPDPASASDAAGVTFSIPQVRAAARAALDENQPELAYKLAQGLLAVNERDPLAYYLIARALQQMKEPALGRRAAGYAFRYTKRPADRYAAAQLAARLSYEARQPTRAQYWLRRSLDVAPNERLRNQAIKDFKRIRAQNPWSLQLQFSVAPSDNVNSGAATDRLTVEGDPWFNWPISSDGQALSGVVLNAAANASYRLRYDKASETRLTGMVSTRQVFLSSASQALVPAGITGRNFSSTSAEIGLTHSFRLGRTPAREHGNGYGRVSFAIGQSWYAQTPYLRYARIGVERNFVLNRNRSLRFAANITRRDYDDRFPANAIELRADYAHKFQGGAQITTGLVLGRTTAGGNNRDHDRGSLYVNYQPAKRLGPVKLSLTLGISKLDYPTYTLLVPVLGGREDTSVFGALTLQFDALEFAGFSPAVTLRARENTSNVSRFDTSELTLSIGIKSSF